MTVTMVDFELLWLRTLAVLVYRHEFFLLDPDPHTEKDFLPLFRPEAFRFMENYLSFENEFSYTRLLAYFISFSEFCNYF